MEHRASYAPSHIAPAKGNPDPHEAGWYCKSSPIAGQRAKTLLEGNGVPSSSRDQTQAERVPKLEAALIGHFFEEHEVLQGEILRIIHNQ